MEDTVVDDANYLVEDKKVDNPKEYSRKKIRIIHREERRK